MEDYQIRKYGPADYDSWNAFVSDAKNATFLFHRDFMEYHSDRFEDYSLVIIKNNIIVSVIPAHINGDELYSHNGLTYGGMVLGNKAKLSEVINIFAEVLKFLLGNNIKKIHIKTIPYIYYAEPSDELLYVLFLTQAVLTRRDSLSVIDLQLPSRVTKNRIQGVDRGRKIGLTIKEEHKFEKFWNTILIPNIQKKHNAQPVHTAAEITKLHNTFPDNIRQFNVYNGDELVAGTTVFVTDHVAHSQYISGNENKNALGSLDFLHYHLINDIFSDKKYFDFGTSNESAGRKLNQGIVFWKESFGARTVAQDFYTVETAAYLQLENVLI